MAKYKTFITVSLVLATAILTVSSLSFAKGEKTPAELAMDALLRDQQPPEELRALAAIPCIAGDAGGYPCNNVDLLAFMPLASIGGGSGNDIWGWTGCGGREFALMGRTSGTAFVEITDPENPVYLGNLPTHTSNTSWRDLKTYADHAFIVSEASSHGMQVFDLSQLCSVASPPVTFSNTAHYSGFGSAHNIVINEDTGYAYGVGTSTCSGGLHMVDISTPTSPANAGCFSSDGYTHDAQCVVYTGADAAHVGQEICFNSNEDTLTIVDVTNKSAPIQLSRTGYSGSSYTHQGWLTDDHAYFLMNDELDEQNNGHNTRTRIWDVSDLDSPTLIGFFDGATAAIDHNLYVKGSFAYEANYRAGLRILDISDVANGNLVEDAFFDIYPSSDSASFNGAWSVYPYFSSGVVIVSGIEQGLFVLSPTLGPDFAIDIQADELELCSPEVAQTTIDVSSLEGFNQSVDLSVEGLPPGAIATFDPTSVLAPGSADFTLDIAAATSGTFTVTVTGMAGPLSHDDSVDLVIAASQASAPVLIEPENAHLIASLTPVLRWLPVANASSYSIEIDDDPTFSSPDYTALEPAVEHTVGQVLDSATTYYWRVSAVNPCGGQSSTVFNFTTTSGGCAVLGSVDVPKAISESGTPTVTSTLDVVFDGQISDLDVVSLSGLHTWINDLDFTLISPAGTQVEVMARSCSDEDDFDLQLDDEASPGSWPCPPVGGGTYQPSNALAAFDGEAATGTWTLQVDDNAAADGGQLSSWGLSICSLDPLPGADLGITGLPPTQTVFAGTSFTYTVEVTNNGPDPAENAFVTISLPSEVTLTATSGCLEDPNGMPTCSIGYLDSGLAAEIEIDVNVDPSAVGIVTAVFSGDFPGIDANPLNDTASVDTRVEDPATLLFQDGFETGSVDQWD